MFSLEPDGFSRSYLDPCCELAACLALQGRKVTYEMPP